MSCVCGRPVYLEVQLDAGRHGVCWRCADRLIREAAAWKDAALREKHWTRTWTPDANLIGLYGEAAFARRFKVPLELRHAKLGGDGGYDATLSNGWTVDVKTARAGTDGAAWVRLEPFHGGQPDATIMVAATWDNHKATLERWHWSRRLREEPVRPIGPKQIAWHALPLEQCFGLGFLETLLHPITPTELQEVGRVAFGIEY